MPLNVPQKIIVHHTGGTDANPLLDTSNQTFEVIDQDHKVKFNFKSSLGFYCGYHYFIDKTGKVTNARADLEEGAHTIGQNTSSIGICLAGNFDTTLPTQAQTEALRDLLKKKTKEFSILPQNIYPHRFFAQKSCYGNKLTDTWARELMLFMTKEERIAKATSLLVEAASLLKGIV